MQSSSLMPFLRRLFHLHASPRGFSNPRSLLKWVLISTLSGLVAGVGAIAFYAAIHYATVVFPGELVGYLPPLASRGRLKQLYPSLHSLRALK